MYIALFLGAWGIFSCRKETSIENGAGQTANFTALVNGVRWSASATEEGATILQGMINITGISADSQEVTITLTDTSVGAYTLNPATTSLAAYGSIDSSSQSVFSTAQGADSTQAGGQVTVTDIDKINKTISGTFAFKVYRSSDGQQRTITSGVFNQIPYTASLPSSSPGDTLTATIDTTAFTAQSIQATSLDGQLTIVGSLSNGNQSIALIMPSYVGPGTYPMTPTGGSPTYMAVYDEIVNGSSTADPASSGTITILQNNTSASRLRGTFQFNTTDLPPHPSHAMTNGFFSVYYGQ
jgi:hypothetical protein